MLLINSKSRIPKTWLKNSRTEGPPQQIDGAEFKNSSENCWKPLRKLVYNFNQLPYWQKVNSVLPPLSMHYAHVHVHVHRGTVWAGFWHTAAAQCIIQIGVASSLSDPLKTFNRDRAPDCPLYGIGRLSTPRRFVMYARFSLCHRHCLLLWVFAPGRIHYGRFHCIPCYTP